MATEVKITKADEAAEVGRELIEQYHRHLEDATIQYLFTSAKRTKAGRVVLGTAARANPILKYFSSDKYGIGADFVLLFSLDEWFALNEAQRAALVDHELCHCSGEYDDNREQWTWSIRGHDVEEFAEVIERHGLWRRDLEQMASAIDQLRLPLAETVER